MGRANFSIVTSLVAIVLLSSGIMVATARAGGVAPCDAPFVFRDSPANIIPVEYLATAADTSSSDPEPMEQLQVTARKLAWLMKLDAWNQPIFGSLGVVAHMFFNRTCDPDEILRELLEGRDYIRPGQIILMIQGKIFIEENSIFLQTRIRGFRRNKVAHAGALSAYMTEDQMVAPLRGDEQLSLTLPLIDVTFPPRLLTFDEFDAIEAAFEDASELHRKPSMNSPGEPLRFAGTQAFQVSLPENNGGWILVREFFSGRQGYIRISPETSHALHHALPELDFLNGALGYLRVQQTLAGSDFPPAPDSSVPNAMRSFDRYLGSEGRAAENEPRALAEALAGAMAAVGPGGWVEARRHFASATVLAPYASTYRNMLGLADSAICCASNLRPAITDPALSFADSLSLDPSNAEALRNLNGYLRNLSRLEEEGLVPAGLNTAGLADRTTAVTKAVNQSMQR